MELPRRSGRLKPNQLEASGSMPRQERGAGASASASPALETALGAQTVWVPSAVRASAKGTMQAAAGVVEKCVKVESSKNLDARAKAAEGAGWSAKTPLGVDVVGRLHDDAKVAVVRFEDDPEVVAGLVVLDPSRVEVSDRLAQTMRDLDAAHQAGDLKTGYG
jgi:hypothetical protein